MRRRGGFTLIEMLVVLGIIVVILALMLPALLAAGEAARRSQCLNNLKQFHLGLQSYESAHGVFPPGVVDSARPFDPAAATTGLSWIAMLLPQVEQSSMYNTLNFEVRAVDSANSTARLTTMSALVCPDSRPRSGSDGPRRGVLGLQTPSPSFPEPGRSSYAGVHHDVEKAIDVDDHGVFFLNSRIRPADVFDGLSQTLILGETAAPTAEGWLAGGRSTLRNTGAAINGVDPSALGGEANVAAWRASGQTVTTLEALITSRELTPPSGYVGGFSSNHRGDGAVFAFGDGSVRFLKATIDPTVYRRLGHREDGEAIDDDAY